jgi:hypothetical protein
MPEAYLQDFSQVVTVASAAIKAADPNSKITVNMSWWFASGRNLQNEGVRLFEAVKEAIDVISFDFYPDNNPAFAAEIPTVIANFRNQFKKPVMISELGLPTQAFSETAQSQAISNSINAIIAGPVKPVAVLMYELHDEANIAGNEGSFGFLHADNSQKIVWNQVVPLMKIAK